MSDMRHIKFRAWDTVQKKWFEPIYRAYAGELLDMHITLSGQPCIRSLEHCSDMRDIDRYILSQFTGLHDKNGKEIYEGDIVDYGYGRYMPVEFIDGAFCICKIPSMPTLMTLYVVIGNIHENPELLK